MKHWIYPANPKYYDVISAFTQEKETPWPINSKVEIGDYVYIYSGKPYQQILFKCEVTTIDLPVEAMTNVAEKYIKIQGKSPNKNFILLKTKQCFEIGESSLLSFGMLKQNGLRGSIMGPQCLDNNPELCGYVVDIEIS